VDWGGGAGCGVAGNHAGRNECRATTFLCNLFEHQGFYLQAAMRYLLTFDKVKFFELKSFTVTPGERVPDESSMIAKLMMKTRRKPDTCELTLNIHLPLRKEAMVMNSAGHIYFVRLERVWLSPQCTTDYSGLVIRRDTRINKEIEEIVSKHT
jgi:hypothetical protein